MMMKKKLLIFMLVLGMASAAYAALSLSVSQPSSASLNVEVTGTIDAGLYIVLSSDNGLSSFAVGSEAPDYAGYTGPTSDLAGEGLWTEPAGFSGEYWVMAASDASVFPITGQFLTATGGSIGDQVNVQAFDETVGFLGDFGTITLIPEPATMLLLGLGGLFLRRRK